MEEEKKEPKQYEIKSIELVYDLEEDLDSLNDEGGWFSGIILNTSIDAIEYAIKNKLSKITLFNLINISLSVEINKSQYADVLNKALDYKILKEEYEEGARIQKLLKKIKK